jgi:hypothetical protein
MVIERLKFDRECPQNAMLVQMLHGFPSEALKKFLLFLTDTASFPLVRTRSGTLFSHFC